MERVPCPICGEEFAPQGLAKHIHHKHGVDMKEAGVQAKKANREALGKPKREQPNPPTIALWMTRLREIESELAWCHSRTRDAKPGMKRALSVLMEDLERRKKNLEQEIEESF